MNGCYYHDFMVIGWELPYPLQVFVCKECGERRKSDTKSLDKYYAERKKELAER